MRVEEAILWVDAFIVGTAAAWALVVVYLPTPDFALLRRLFWVVAGGIGVFVIVWNVTAFQRSWVRIPITAVMFAAVGVLAAEGTRWTYRAALAQAQQSAPVVIPPALLDAQIQELREIDAFIGKKDEMGLRTTFDFPNMFKFDIQFAKGRLVPGSLTAAEIAEMDAFFSGGGGLIDTRFSHLTPVSNVAQFETILGKIGILNLSKTYVDNLAKLKEFESSSMLPSDVRAALHTFRETVEEDANLMFDVINGQFATDPNNLIYDSLYQSRYYGAVSSTYATRFVLLRPKAERVSEAIRHYLEIK